MHHHVFWAPRLLVTAIGCTSGDVLVIDEKGLEIRNPFDVRNTQRVSWPETFNELKFSKLRKELDLGHYVYCVETRRFGVQHLPKYRMDWWEKKWVFDDKNKKVWCERGKITWL